MQPVKRMLDAGIFWRSTIRTHRTPGMFGCGKGCASGCGHGRAGPSGTRRSSRMAPTSHPGQIDRGVIEPTEGRWCGPKHTPPSRGPGKSWLVSHGSAVGLYTDGACIRRDVAAVERRPADLQTCGSWWWGKDNNNKTLDSSQRESGQDRLSALAMCGLTGQ